MDYNKDSLYAVGLILVVLKCKAKERDEVYDALFPDWDVTKKEFDAWIQSLKNSSIPKVSEEKSEEMRQKMMNYSKGVPSIKDPKDYIRQLCKVAGLNEKQTNDMILFTDQFMYALEREEDTKSYTI